jgi:RimJ/RimL family protein N-acetyltransferase
MVLETERLTLREIDENDAPFVRRLLNEPSWLRFIGDKGVKSDDDARTYIRNVPRASYARHGFGLWLVVRKSDCVAMGMCGLIKRDSLEDVDVGFAFQPDFWGAGYAHEATMAVLAYGKNTVSLKRIVAVTTLDNESSIKLLRKSGFILERTLRLGEGGEEVNLFAMSLS